MPGLWEHQVVAPVEHALRCGACESPLTVTADTIFQDTRKPLRIWFQAKCCVGEQKNGRALSDLNRVLEIGSDKKAWTWLHTLREWRRGMLQEKNITEFYYHDGYAT